MTPTLDENGKLPAYAWPGGYPLFYLDGDNCVLCPECANKSINDEVPSFRPVACDVHWEGEPLICDHCNAEIESAYGGEDEE